MPMYEYTCNACGHYDTLLEKINASKQKKCPECGKVKSFKRMVSAAAFHLKGDGWYVTDFRDKDKPKPSENEKKEKTATASDDKTSTKADTKDQTKTKDTKSTPAKESKLNKAKSKDK